MIRKSYFANTMEQAFAKARQELGEDVLLLESRRPPASNRAQGGFEVVVGLDEPKPVAVTTPPRRPAPPADANADPQWKSLLAEVSGLRQQLMRMSSALCASNATPDPESEVLLERLEDRGVSAETATAWLKAASERPETGSVVEKLRSFLGGELKTSQTASNALAVVGPAGAGKTTALVKLAFQLGLNQGKRITFLSLDDARIGAAEQLKACAAILGANFVQGDYSGGALRPPIKAGEYDLLLVDTPGLTPSEGDARHDLAHALAQIDGLEVLLVLTASTRTADLRSAMQRWQVMKPDHLLITHMDEAGSHGHVIALAAEGGLPVSYLGWGRQIPEDLEPASREKLIQLLLAEEKRTSVAAA